MMREALIAMSLALVAAPDLCWAKPDLAPMQLQAIQQKEFEASKQAVFGSVVDVFQDLGYSIGSADLNTGFITAESATVNKTSLWDALGYASGSGNTRATAFIEQMPSGLVRVRLNFVSTKTISSLYGQAARKDKPIQDPAVYQRAFEKIDEALFVRNAVAAPTAPPAALPPVSSDSTQAPVSSSPSETEAPAAPATTVSHTAPNSQQSATNTRPEAAPGRSAVPHDRQCGMVRQPDGSVKIVPC